MHVPVEPFVSVNLTQGDINVIAKAFDIAIKATGIEGAKMILPVLAKVENAVTASNQATNQSAGSGASALAGTQG